jgi:hypothetical protein
MKQILIVLLTGLAMLACVAAAQAGSDSLLARSSAQIATEVNGLDTPDAVFFIASHEPGGAGFVEGLSKVPTGQGKTQVVQSSYGCSTGCSTGCSVGCSTGCSVGCSSGCSYGCR